MSSSSNSKFLTLLSTGNTELDNRLGGGIPTPSLLVMEGDNGTGKTALCNQLTYGFTSAGKKVMYVTTESSVRIFLEQAGSISYDLTTPYLKGLLTIFPAHLEGIKWDRKNVNRFMDVFIDFLRKRAEGYDIVVVDSISMLMSYLSLAAIHNLITDLRCLVRTGKSLIITVHPKMVSDDVARVLTAGSDVYFRLSIAEIGGRAVKVINVVKIRGVPLLAESAIAFDVDPAFGIKIVPLALAKA